MPRWLLQRCCPLSLMRCVVQGQSSHLSYYKGYEYCRTGNPTRAAYEKVWLAHACETRENCCC